MAVGLNIAVVLNGGYIGTLNKADNSKHHMFFV